MSILLINGSPNKNGNTITLTKKFLKDKEFETLHLVDYKHLPVMVKILKMINLMKLSQR